MTTSAGRANPETILQAIYFGSASADTNTRRFAAFFGVFSLIVTVLLGFRGDSPATVGEAFLPIVATAWSLADIFTATILIAQYALTGHRRLASFAAAYGLSGISTGPYLLYFPGFFTSQSSIAHGQLSVYIWLTWHLAFPVLILAGTLSDGTAGQSSCGDRNVKRRVLLGLATFLGALVLWFGALMLLANALPSLISGGRFTPAFHNIAIPLVLAANVIVGCWILRKRHRRLTTLDVWVSIALFASAGDIALNLLARGRFSAYWYLGKCEAVFVACVVLFMFLHEMTSLLLRVERRRRETLSFMASSSDQLFRSCMDGADPITRIAEIAVEALGDWSAIYMNDALGEPRCVAVAHRDPNIRKQLESFHRKYPDRQPANVKVVASTGESLLFEKLPNVMYDSADYDDADRVDFLQRTLRIGSVMFVPLCIDSKVLGVLAVGSAIDGQVYTPENLHLCEILARQTATAVQQSYRFRREERVATFLQRSSLPRTLPLIAGIDVSACYASGQNEADIGGDWYDVFPLPDGRVVISLGDVSGSGIQAAGIMGSIRQWLRAAATVRPDPAEMLTIADGTMCTAFPDVYASVFVGILDLERATLVYSSAGHPPPLLHLADGSVVKLDHVGLPLGIGDAYETSLAPNMAGGSFLVLYTDGLIESTRDIVEGERRLRDVLRAESHFDAVDAASKIYDQILTGAASDDVTVLTLRFDAAQPQVDSSARSFSCQIGKEDMEWYFDARSPASVFAVRDGILDFLVNRGASASDVFTGELVYGELLSNVLRHAPGEVNVKIAWHGASPVLHVIDQGRGFQHSPLLPKDAYAETGRGLFMVASLTQAFSAERRRAGTGTDCRAVLAINRDRLHASAALNHVTSLEVASLLVSK